MPLDQLLVTVLSSADLEDRGITSLNGIATAVPAISSTPALNSLSTLSLYMRGEGPAAPGQITLDGAVGLYQDGFYISRFQANTFDLLDLERAEILAGPQGATYGRNTAGGVIDLVSETPSGKLRFNQDVDFGNRNSYRVLSSVDTPRWYGVAAKVTAVVSGVDGYVKNELATQHDYGEEKQRAVRLQLLWDGIANFQAKYFIERNSLDSTPEYDSNPALNGENLISDLVYFADPNGPMRSTYRSVILPLSTSAHTAQGLTATWQALPSLAIESRTGYRTMNADESQDYAEFFGLPLQTLDLYQQHQFSQELRFSGELFGKQIGYLLGASYFREAGAHSSFYDVFTTGASDLSKVTAQSNSRAVFAQLRWQPAILGGRLEIAAAGRYTKDNKDAQRGIVDTSGGVLENGALSHLSYKKTTPELSVSYRWTAAVSTYAKVATAYQAGGALETAPVGSFGSSNFRPESSTTYEVGLRTALLDDRLHLDVAVFDSRRKDVQYLLPIDALDSAALDFQRVTVRGANLDLRFTPLQDLSFAASAAYLHWSIDRVDVLAGTLFDPATGSGSPYVVGGNINTVFALPYTPKYSGTLAGDYTFLHLDRRDVMVHLDYVYRAKMFAEGGAGPAVPGARFDTQPAYGLLNGRITMSQETDWSHRLKFSLWGRNILNRKYYQPATANGNGVTAFDANGSVSGYVSTAGAWAAPRTYGLNVRFEY